MASRLHGAEVKAAGVHFGRDGRILSHGRESGCPRTSAEAPRVDFMASRLVEVLWKSCMCVHKDMQVRHLHMDDRHEC